MARVSILLPTFNGDRFLALQIESILNQTAGDFELTIIDDGSTDNTEAIIDSYAGQDRRVNRLSSIGNYGQKIRLRQLLAHATGEFVAFADQDDIWAPDRNARLLQNIGGKALAFGRSQLIDASGQDLGQSILDTKGVDPFTAGPLQTLLLPLVSAHAAIVRRDWLDVAVLTGPSPFDWIMGLEAMLSGGLVYDPDAVVFHRVHETNQMNRKAVVVPSKRRSWAQYRESIKSGRPSRLDFYLKVDQLSRSMAIDAAERDTMFHVALACRYAWFHPLDLRLRKGRRLERALKETLGGLAQSPEDLAIFTEQIRAMTRGSSTVKHIISGLLELNTARR